MNSLQKLSTIVVFFLVLSAVGPNRGTTGYQVRDLEHDVRAFGAKGDGRTLDTEAINKAIEAAAAAGGGTVRFSAGRYLPIRKPQLVMRTTSSGAGRCCCGARTGAIVPRSIDTRAV